MSMDTEFAPAERATVEEVKRQYALLSELPFVREFLDAVPNMAMVLNHERQIVFANLMFCKFAGIEDVVELVGVRQGDALGCANLQYIGKRPGEAAGCVRADLTEGGCGTTLFCQTCGAVQSILNSQENNADDVQECRMVCGEAKDPLDLRVWSRPIVVKGETFTVFSVMDISDEKRRSALERIFFHDVLNTAGGLKGLSEILVETGLSEEEKKDIANMLSESAEQLLEEIMSQRLLLAAENGELQVSVESIESQETISRIINQFHSLCQTQAKKLIVNESAEFFDFASDPVLIRRVLINLTKNALEAVGAGETITLNSFSDGDEVCFSVHNEMVMPLEIQRQLFIRSFSTKGSGRGLGTYSIKLITEKYLQGRVSFVSDEEQGTIFTVRYPKVIAGTSKNEDA